jgi:hypothetical protein
MARWLLIFVVGFLAVLTGMREYRLSHIDQSDRPHLPSVGFPAAYAIPVQHNLNPDRRFKYNGYELQLLAEFAVHGRVLMAEHYYLDRGAELAPVDLALGWGRMADRTVTDRLEMSQGLRWYTYSYRGEPPIPQHEIAVSSANMHMIPATAEIAKKLQALRPGETVRITGYLVEARAADGFLWRSSLSRTDAGKGACELVYVQALEEG